MITSNLYINYIMKTTVSQLCLSTIILLSAPVTALAQQPQSPTTPFVTEDSIAVSEIIPPIHRQTEMTQAYGSQKDLASDILHHIVREENVTILTGDKTQGDSVNRAFRENAPRNRRIESIPRFAIVGSDNKFYMGIGVSLRATASFDFGADNPSAYDFIPSAFLPSQPGNRSNLRLSAQTSSFYINVVALPGTKNRIGLFFSGDFKNDGYKFKVGHIYAKYRGLTVGYTHSLFEDGDAMPYTIDDQGPNGEASLTTIVAYWTQQFGHGFSVDAGIDAPECDYTLNGYVSTVNQRIPAIPAAIQYTLPGNAGHVRLAAIMRPMQYRDLSKSALKALVGWGLQLSGSYSPVSPLTLYYSGAYGRGISNYLQDSNGMNTDATASITTPGQLRLGSAWSVVGGLQYKFSRKFSSNLMYSQMRYYRANGCMTPQSDYRYGQYVTANLIWRLNRFAQFGIEYNWGKCNHYQGNSLHSNRFQVLWGLAF